MLLTFVCLISAAAAVPVSVLYDRRQDGELNVSADVQNILFLVAIPDKMSMPFNLYELIKNKGLTRQADAQERADHVMDAFVEPSTPYQVEIGSDRSAEGGGRAVEVVIAGRRRLETEPLEDGDDELKLIGATEQCGPERERDPVTLMCRFKKLDVEPKPSSQSTNSIQKEPVKENSKNDKEVQPKPQTAPEVIVS